MQSTVYNKPERVQLELAFTIPIRGSTFITELNEDIVLDTGLELIPPVHSRSTPVPHTIPILARVAVPCTHRRRSHSITNAAAILWGLFMFQHLDAINYHPRRRELLGSLKLSSRTMHRFLRLSAEFEQNIGNEHARARLPSSGTSCLLSLKSLPRV